MRQINLDTGHILIKVPQIGLCSWSLLLPPSKESLVWKNLDGHGKVKYNAFDSISVKGHSSQCFACSRNFHGAWTSKWCVLQKSTCIYWCDYSSLRGFNYQKNRESSDNSQESLYYITIYCKALMPTDSRIWSYDRKSMNVGDAQKLVNKLGDLATWNPAFKEQRFLRNSLTVRV